MPTVATARWYRRVGIEFFDTHCGIKHVPGVKTPVELHDVSVSRAYPELHEGVHELPAATLLVHVPTRPFVGAALASQVETKSPREIVYASTVYVPGGPGPPAKYRR